MTRLRALAGRIAGVVPSVVATVGALASAANAGAEQARVELRAEAEARAARYTLGDVADVRSGDPAVARALAALEVGVAPRVGVAQSIERRAIADDLARRHPALRGRIAWSGADAVTVRVTGQALGADAVLALAERTLIEALAQRGLRGDVQVAGRVDELRLPVRGERRLTARLADGWVPAKRMCVWVDAALDDSGYRSIPVWFAVRAEGEVLVAERPMQAGERLRAETVRSASVDVTSLPAAPLQAGAKLDGLRLRHAIDAGQALVASAVEPRPAVARNESVDVEIAVGAIRLQTAAVALADARLGETVKLRAANNERFTARVVADGLARIEGR